MLALWKNYDAFSIHLLLFSTTGVWQLPTQNRCLQTLHFVIKIFSTITYLTLIIFELVHFLLGEKSLTFLVDFLCTWLLHCIVTFKTVVFVAHEKDIAGLVARLARDEGPSTADERAVLTKRSREVKILGQAFYSLCNMTAAFWTAFPLLITSRRLLPYPYWLPWVDVYQSPAYEIVYVYHILVMFFVLVCNVGSSDLLLHGSVIQVCRHYEVLSLRIDRLSDHKDHSILEQVKNCVRYHQRIISEVEMIEKLFSVAIFIHLSIGTFVTATVSYDLLKESASISAKLFQRLAFMGSALFSMFFYCFYGTELDKMNDSLLYAVYNVPWYNMDVEVRGLLRVMLLRAQKKPRIAGLKIIVLQLGTYLQILRLIYNTMALLGNTDEH